MIELPEQQSQELSKPVPARRAGRAAPPAWPGAPGRKVRPAKGRQKLQLRRYAK